MYYVTVNLPNLAEEAEVELDGLGIFVNGETKEVSLGEANAFRAKRSVFVDAYDGEDPDHQVVVGRVNLPGPTLAQYYKDSPYITVSTTDPRKKDDPPTEEKPAQEKITTPKEKVNN